MLGLGLMTTACTSNSTTSTPSTSTTTSAKPAAAAVTSFLGQIHAGSQIASTVPAKGDVNPYGLAVVPATAGRLTVGNILVSNFNDKANTQTNTISAIPQATTRTTA